MLQDPGCYEERYRLTGQAAAGLAIGLISVGLGVLWQPPISAAAVVLAIPVIFSAITVLLAMPALIAMARRKTAFRADYAGHHARHPARQPGLPARLAGVHPVGRRRTDHPLPVRPV
jgi:hypothetical protein